MKISEKFVSWLKEYDFIIEKVPIDQISDASVAHAINRQLKWLKARKNPPSTFRFRRAGVEISMGYPSGTEYYRQKNQKGVSLIGIILNQLVRDNIIRLVEIAPPNAFGHTHAIYEIIDQAALDQKSDQWKK